MKFPFIATALLITTSLPVHALQPATQGDPYVEKVTLQWGGNAAPVVILRNTSGSPLADKINIQPESNVARIALNGNVKCMKDKQINYDHARAYFGPALMSSGSIDDSQVLYSAPYHPSFTEWDGVGNGQWNTEAGNQQTFDVPLGAIKSGPANVAFDPVAEFDKRLQAHVQQGGKRVDFLRKNQEFVISRTLSLGGWCKKDSTSRPGVNSAFVNLKVRYVGDNSLIEPPQVNVQLGNNMPNQIGQNLPLQLSSANFQPNMPHHIGTCPPAQDPVIRVNYNGSGRGTLRFMINDGGAVYGTEDIAFDSTNGPGHFDFAYPLAAKLIATPAWAEPNKTVHHNLTIRAKYRDEKSGTWSDWKNYGSAQWNHRCTPALAVQPLGNAGGIQAGGQAPGDSPQDAPTVQAKPKLAPLGVGRRAAPADTSPGTPPSIATPALSPAPAEPGRLAPPPLPARASAPARAMPPARQQ